MNHLSISKLRIFLQCPRKFQHHYILGEPEEMNFHSLFGTLIHETLKRYHKNQTVNLLDLYKEEFANSKYRTLEATHFEKGQAILLDYQQTKLAYPDREILKLEERFEGFLENGIPVIAVVDRVDKIDEETIELIDYKTGSAYFPTPYEMQEDEQLSMYDVIVRQWFPWAKNVRLTLHFFKGPKLMIERRPDQRQAFLDYLTVVYQQMMAEKEYPARLNQYCGYCSYRSTCPVFQQTVLESAEAAIGNIAVIEPGKKLAVRPVDIQLPEDLPKVVEAIERLKYKSKIVEQVQKDLQQIMIDYMENQQSVALDVEGKTVSVTQKEYRAYDAKLAYEILNPHGEFFKNAKVGKEKVQEFITTLRRGGREQEALAIETGLTQGEYTSFSKAILKIDNKRAKKKIDTA